MEEVLYCLQLYASLHQGEPCVNSSSQSKGAPVRYTHTRRDNSDNQKKKYKVLQQKDRTRFWPPRHAARTMCSSRLLKRERDANGDIGRGQVLSALSRWVHLCSTGQSFPFLFPLHLDTRLFSAWKFRKVWALLLISYIDPSHSASLIGMILISQKLHWVTALAMDPSSFALITDQLRISLVWEDVWLMWISKAGPTLHSSGPLPASEPCLLESKRSHSVHCWNMPVVGRGSLLQSTGIQRSPQDQPGSSSWVRRHFVILFRMCWTNP